MDKKDTSLALKNFELQLRNLFEVVMGKLEENDTSDAMIAKKPLGGWSCASCQKNLINMSGHLSDYQINSKFPYRDPNERLNKVG